MLSPLPHKPNSKEFLIDKECKTEIEVAWAQINDVWSSIYKAYEGNISPCLIEHLVLDTSSECRYLTAAGTFSAPGPDDIFYNGTITLSGTPLWRRATPYQRRNIVLHELAHCVVTNLHYDYCGHDKRWKMVMMKMGLVPNEYHRIPCNDLRSLKTF